MKTKNLRDHYLQLFFIITIFYTTLRMMAIGRDMATSFQMLGAVTGGKYGGAAFIKDKDSGKMQAFRMGSLVFNQGTLVSISRTSLTLKGINGNLTTLSTKLGGSLSQQALTKKPTGNVDGDQYSEEGLERNGNKTVIDSATKERMLKEDLPKFLMQASSEPIIENGQITGFRMFQFEPDSIFAKLGMKDGDVVREINGVPLNDVAKTVQFLNGLRNESNVSVNIVRDGQPVSLDLSVR